MRILLFNDQFESGGAARVACTMCNEFFKRDQDLHVLTDMVSWKICYPLNPDIPLSYVNMRCNGRGLFSRIKAFIRQTLSVRHYVRSLHPDVIIAIQANAYVRSLLASLFTGVPLIVADHTSFARKMDWINNFTRHYLYKFADGISILAERDAKILGTKYPQKRVIYNPNSYPTLVEITSRDKTILCAGRFDIWKLKGFDIIFQIWSVLSQNYPDWELQIAGSGTPESSLTINSMIDEYGISGRVKLLGQVQDMRTLYSHTGVFALPSRTEGMPMVLLEAMSQGCPCVAFDIGGVSSEMLKDESGIVVRDGDIMAFSQELERLLNDDSLRKKLSLNAISESAKFSVDSFVNAWFALINDVLK